ncbi:MAG: YheT family hydrolase [Verrucomicrobiales bacterium]
MNSVLGGHWETIVPSLFRKMARVTTRAERLELDDGDFLDLLWRSSGSDRLVILSHGLEGSAHAAYMQGMAATCLAGGWDVLAWHFRSCSGELNRLPRFYHSGATEDLAAVLRHALAVHPARRVDLVGFSLGGNMTLKYLGECGGSVHPRVHRAVAFSVPCDLASSSRALATRFNREVYMRRFISSLTEKIRRKAVCFPGVFDLSGLEAIRTFQAFDDRFTAPLHGFQDAEDYWEKSSSRPFLPFIRIPTLLVNAANDPFLGPGCYPHEESSTSDCFTLEVPPSGGHVGFGLGKPNAAERRALAFLSADEEPPDRVVQRRASA